MVTPRAIVFDLDGTLVDSRRDLVKAVNLTRADHGLPPLTLEKVVGMVGRGARRLVASALSELGPATVDEALATFFRHYSKVLLETTDAYPGVPEMLVRLADRFPLAVLTNKPEGFSRRILEHLGFAARFREVLGGDTLPTRKPDPSGLAELARRLGTPIARTLLVGDSAVDAATAEAAGASFALVAWGFTPTAELHRIAAKTLLERPSDLVADLLGSHRDP